MRRLRIGSRGDLRKNKMPITEKEVLELMLKIMPKTWHVLTNIRDIMKPGHLYIQVLVSNSNRGAIVGETGPLHFLDKRVALATLWVHYEFQWRDTVVHELAHIAVNRWLSWKTKNYTLVNDGAGKRINKHGAIFEKALDTFRKRVGMRG